MPTIIQTSHGRGLVVMGESVREAILSWDYKGDLEKVVVLPAGPAYYDVDSSIIEYFDAPKNKDDGDPDR